MNIEKANALLNNALYRNNNAYVIIEKELQMTMEDLIDKPNIARTKVLKILEDIDVEILSLDIFTRHSQQTMAPIVILRLHTNILKSRDVLENIQIKPIKSYNETKK